MLDRTGFHIFRPEGADLVQEFTLPHPPIPWDALESFPSRGLPGVVLWASEGVSYSRGTVVCYVGGKPRVVFEGQYVDFIDLDLDGIPEILEEEASSETEQLPQFATVWTWDGSRYVKVKRVAFDQLYSKEIVAEVRSAKKRVSH